MKKVKEMKEGALYLFKSVACSNTVYFEDLEHTKMFLELANQHLKDYLFIHEYMLSKDGWLFVARLKSKERILQAYNNKRERKNKPLKTNAVWKIVSEQFRLFIGGYVTKYNASTGREGGLVKRCYERYFFETNASAKRMIERIRRREVGLQQGKKMYRAKKGHYRIAKTLGKGAIYLSSRRTKRRKAGGSELGDLLKVAVFQRVSSVVLTKQVKNLIKLTKKAHNTPSPAGLNSSINKI